MVLGTVNAAALPIGVATFLGALLIVVYLWSRRRSKIVPSTLDGGKVRVRICFATTKGTSRTLAHKLFSTLIVRNDVVVDILDVKDLEVETLAQPGLVVFVLSTFTGGEPPVTAEAFRHLLRDMATDFRYPRDHLRQVRVGVFGLGDVVYGEHFNMFAKTTAEWLKSLGAQFVTPPIFATEQRMQGLFAEFSKRLVDCLDRNPTFDTEEPESEEASDGDDNATKEVPDVEDIVEPGERRELLYPRLRDSLSKQGYSLIGSHSGVKLCRWTKSMLRGRGGCYKHTFYNISSFQCMEMTPSLACANKCVFCWRHHTNPVAKSFEWKHDTPEFLVDNALAAHRQMIKQMKGVPGVQADRFAEASNVKHCALSLVGEPIIYPEINKFVGLLHSKHISTFLVTNAQFPDRIAQLAPVTQLYVSIDAATKEELRVIDRPIFDDFWERMLDCVKQIGLKHQRTVFRLTLVNHYNVSNLADYVRLVVMGKPDFIEVKGMTYCGASGASDLTMKNVPYHGDVIAFCEDLCRQLSGEYEIACEHEHSCCVLLAKKCFCIGGTWHTWIDYAKFFELVESGRTDFTSLEYAAPTPSWAVFQSKERGFDPLEVRQKREKPITASC